MSRIIAVLILGATIFLCAKMTYKREKKLTILPLYVTVDTTMVNFKQIVYVPVHANIYMERGSRQLRLTTVLKIRNTSISDSIYVFKIKYYDTEGEELKNYIDSVLLIKPLATVQIHVKHDEFKKKGDNFIVEWGGVNSKQPPLIQALSSDPGSKFALTTEGVLMENTPP